MKPVIPALFLLAMTVTAVPASAATCTDGDNSGYAAQAGLLFDYAENSDFTLTCTPGTTQAIPTLTLVSPGWYTTNDTVFTGGNDVHLDGGDHASIGQQFAPSGTAFNAWRGLQQIGVTVANAATSTPQTFQVTAIAILSAYDGADASPVAYTAFASKEATQLAAGGSQNLQFVLTDFVVMDGPDPVGQGASQAIMTTGYVEQFQFSFSADPAASSMDLELSNAAVQTSNKIVQPGLRAIDTGGHGNRDSWVIMNDHNQDGQYTEGEDGALFGPFTTAPLCQVLGVEEDGSSIYVETTSDNDGDGACEADNGSIHYGTGSLAPMLATIQQPVCVNVYPTATGFFLTVHWDPTFTSPCSTLLWSQPIYTTIG